jgi:pimeloyl-ACP methyl ester carboxylesterase/ketosteroid isomerase-like protein
MQVHIQVRRLVVVAALLCSCLTPTASFVHLFAQSLAPAQVTQAIQPAQSAPPSPNQLYEQFAEAYARLDASAVSDLYTPNAVLHNLYDLVLPTSLTGQAAIAQYFSDVFRPYKEQGRVLRLTFKVGERREALRDGRNVVYDNGVYRLDILSPREPTKSGFGRFSTVAEFDGKRWKFSADANTNATFPEYDDVLTPAIPTRETASEQDATLFAGFYDTLLGDYFTEDNECIVIGRSQTRPFAYFEKTQDFRGLQKVTTHRWKAGNTVLLGGKAENAVREFVFHPEKVEILEQGKPPIKATKRARYQTENVQFTGSNAALMAGTLFHPHNPNGKAIVLVHGSGPQDRNGYASIIRLLADIFAREGITVLTYDKQGVGSSGGNWERENFGDLATDALAVMTFLRKRNDLALRKIGLAGSSQAGWVIAKAVEASPNVDFVLTIGAAGSGISVVEQNLYNTRIQMQCSQQFSPKQVDAALKQQRLFFDYVLTQRNAEALDRFTAECAADSALRDWLFPTSKGVDFQAKNQWYTALEIGFDPLAVWRSYTKPALMLFGEFDDSTPTTQVRKNLEQLRKKNIQISVLQGSQHLGLQTNSVCREIQDLSTFHPQFFATMKQWLKRL